MYAITNGRMITSHLRSEPKARLRHQFGANFKVAAFSCCYM